MRAHIRLRSGALASALALATALGCYPSAAPPGLTRGLWSGTTGERRFVFEFMGVHMGVLALVHTMDGGRRVTEKPVYAVTYRPPRIEILIDGDLSYVGHVDLSHGRIEGHVLGLGPEPRGLELRRVDRASIAGFPARPASLRDGPVYTWSRPLDTGDGWVTASPEEVGMRREALEATVSAIIAGEAGLLHSILIARRGKLVLEEYFHGYGRDDLADLGTCGLGVASLLTGIAIDNGFVASPQAPVLDFFPELAARTAEGWDGVSLRHLLTLTAGSRDRRESSRLTALGGDALIADTLSVSPAHEPGTRFGYSSRVIDILSGILNRATGDRVDEFAADRLFRPLGIESVEWSPGADGEFIRLDEGLRLRPRDLAKLGQLVLEQGRWEDRQVVSAEWIRKSTTQQLDFLIAGDEEYGYLWWMPPLPQGAGGGRVITASGKGSQYLYVVPSLDAVLVITGGNHFNGKTFLPPHVLAPLLIPAFER